MVWEYIGVFKWGKFAAQTAGEVLSKRCRKIPQRDDKAEEQEQVLALLTGLH